MSHEEEAEGSEAPLLKRKLTNREVILKALSEPDSGTFMLTQQMIVDAVRQNDKRPALIRWACPDDWPMNLGGHEPLVDYYFCLRVPREFVEHLEDQTN